MSVRSPLVHVPHPDYPFAHVRSPLGCNRCDHCGRVSPLYELWPSCRECQSEVCLACAEPGSVSEPDLDCPARATCPVCARADAESPTP